MRRANSAERANKAHAGRASVGACVFTRVCIDAFPGAIGVFAVCVESKTPTLLREVMHPPHGRCVDVSVANTGLRVFSRPHRGRLTFGA